jgi:hypothetical protein
MQDEWVQFTGRASEDGDAWILETDNGSGAISAPKPDVRFVGLSIEIRRGTAVRILKRPTGGGKPTSIEVPAGDCPCGKTVCIGYVMICCRDNRVIGTGLGIWDDCP